MHKPGYIYIITNKNKTTLYIGVTSDLPKRIYEHRNHLIKTSFSHRYNLEHLIYYEVCGTIEAAILREKEIKKWNRAKKEHLIYTLNPEWNDLTEKISNY